MVVTARVIRSMPCFMVIMCLGSFIATAAAQQAFPITCPQGVTTNTGLENAATCTGSKGTKNPAIKNVPVPTTFPTSNSGRKLSAITPLTLVQNTYPSTSTINTGLDSNDNYFIQASLDPAQGFDYFEVGSGHTWCKSGKKWTLSSFNFLWYPSANTFICNGLLSTAEDGTIYCNPCSKSVVTCTGGDDARGACDDGVKTTNPGQPTCYGDGSGQWACAANWYSTGSGDVSYCPVTSANVVIKFGAKKCYGSFPLSFFNVPYDTQNSAGNCGPSKALIMTAQLFSLPAGSASVPTDAPNNLPPCEVSYADCNTNTPLEISIQVKQNDVGNNGFGFGCAGYVGLSNTATTYPNGKWLQNGAFSTTCCSQNGIIPSNPGYSTAHADTLQNCNNCFNTNEGGYIIDPSYNNYLYRVNGYATSVGFAGK